MIVIIIINIIIIMSFFNFLQISCCFTPGC